VSRSSPAASMAARAREPLALAGRYDKTRMQIEAVRPRLTAIRSFEESAAWSLQMMARRRPGRRG